MADTERVGRVRKGRLDGGFTVVHNSLINHPSLSIEARGLMIYLLSRPDDWELRLTDVRRFLGTAGNPCGRDKSYRILSELRQHRYLVMCENIMDKHFAGVTYYIFPEPVGDVDEVQRRHRAGENALEVPLSTPLPENTVTVKTPLPEKPEAGQLPLPDFPYPEKPEAIVNKDIIQTTESPFTPQGRKTRRRIGLGGIEPQPDQPSVAYYEPWSIGWTEYRIRSLMSGMEKAPPTAPKIVQITIDRGGERGQAERRAFRARHCWPSVTERDRRAIEDGRGCSVTPGVLSFDLALLAERYHSVPVDSEEFRAWQEAHRLKGWPVFPTPPRRATHVLLPKAGPAALDMPNDEEVAA